MPGIGASTIYTASDIGVSGTYSNAIIDIIYNAVGALTACVVIGIKKLFN